MRWEELAVNGGEVRGVGSVFIGKPHHTAVSLTGGQRKEEEKRVMVGSVLRWFSVMYIIERWF